MKMSIQLLILSIKYIIIIFLFFFLKNKKFKVNLKIKQNAINNIIYIILLIILILFLIKFSENIDVCILFLIFSKKYIVPLIRVLILNLYYKYYFKFSILHNRKYYSKYAIYLNSVGMFSIFNLVCIIFLIFFWFFDLKFIFGILFIVFNLKFKFNQEFDQAVLGFYNYDKIVTTEFGFKKIENYLECLVLSQFFYREFEYKKDFYFYNIDDNLLFEKNLL